jgi:hypothetical protein
MMSRPWNTPKPETSSDAVRPWKTPAIAAAGERQPPDEVAIAAHVKMLHTLAAPLAGQGKLVVASFGQVPDTGVALRPIIGHFQIGDETGMAAFIVRHTVDPHRNVYVPLVVVRPDLQEGKKAAESDVIAVLGLVGDFDDAKAREYAKRLPMAACFVIESSKGRFQAAYLFDRPMSVANAKTLGKALADFAKCDHGTKDMSHVWRIPGTLNWPNKKKVGEGRSLVPQLVRVAEPWGGELIEAVALSNAIVAMTPAEPEAVGTRAVDVRPQSATPIVRPAYGPTDPELVRQALSSISADDYHTWIEMGMALKTGMGERGRAIWDAWSATSTKFNAKKQGGKWRSFQRDDVGLGTVFHLAEQCGWKWPEWEDALDPIENARMLAVTARLIENALRENGVLAVDDYEGPLDDVEEEPCSPSIFSSHVAQDQNYNLLDIDDLDALPQQRWQVKGVLPTEGIAAFYGPTASGKTFLVLDLVMSIASGKEWFGHKVRQAPVVYAALEGEHGIANRVRAYRKTIGDPPKDFIKVMTQPIDIRSFATRKRFVKTINDVGFLAPVVIIDTLSQAAPGADENSPVDMGRIIQAVKEIQRELGGLVVLVHHSGKDQAAGMRGHSSLLAALDAVVEVTRNGEARSWIASKVKDGSDKSSHPFALKVCELGVDEDGDPITSCVVEDGDAERAQEPKQKPLAPDTKKAIVALVEALRANGVSAQEAGIPAHVAPYPERVVYHEHWRGLFFEAKRFAPSEGARRTAFSKAHDRLEELHAIGVHENYFWLRRGVLAVDEVENLITVTELSLSQKGKNAG